MREVLYKKGMVIAIICLFVGAGVIPITGAIKNFEKVSIVANPTSMDTITVDDEGDGDYTSIPEAINNANPGDIIEVYSGTYVGNVIVDKQLTLTGIDFELGSGDDIGKPIIDGGRNGSVVYLISDAVNISRFTIQNSGRTGALDTEDSGIEIRSNGNIILGNNFSNNLDGVGVFSSSSNIIIANNFSSNVWDGIFLYNSNANLISENIFLNDGVGVYNSFQNSFLNNIVNEKPLLYLENQSDGSIGEDVGQIILVNCNNITIQNQTIASTSHGIVLANTDNCLIYNNNCSSNRIDGILLVQSTCNKIFNNSFSNNSIGIHFFSSSNNNKVSGNILKNNRYYGVELSDFSGTSNNNIFYLNMFISNEWNAWDTGSNQWDNGSIGNYWGNHWYKKDSDYDGISDRPYYIPLKGIDNFPLMAPVGMKPDNVTPEMEIELPKEGYWHIGNIMDPYPSQTGQTGIIALPWMNRFEIKVRASDESGAPTVIVFIDDFNVEEWWETDFIKLESVGAGSDLYKGKLEKWMVGMHTLTFVCYDKYAQDEIEEMKAMFLYFPRLVILP